MQLSSRAVGVGGRIERLEPRQLLALSLLGDFNNTTAGSFGLGPLALGSVGILYADDGIHGYELFKTDGTAAGTELLKDIAPGPARSIDRMAPPAGGLVYLSADDGTLGDELWRTDGTSDGTIRLTDVPAGQSFSILDSVADPDHAGVAILVANQLGIWRSDGSAAGTSQIANVNTSNVAELNGAFYFLGAVPGGGASALWRSDGSAGGLTMIRPFSGVTNSRVTALNGRLYFTATDATLNSAGDEPWSSDGTAPGTVPLGDLWAGTNPSSAQQFTSFGGLVYFFAQTASASTSVSLFRTDGSANSAVSLATVGTFPAFDFPPQQALVPYNGMLYFTGNDSVHGKELWRSDGTAAGTGPFLDLNAGAGSSSPGAFGLFDGRLYFAAKTPTGTYEYHSTDGTVAGTTLLRAVAVGFAGQLTPPTFLNGRMYFHGFDSLHGLELWSTDGTADGTTMLADLNANTNDFNPSAMTLGPGGYYYFAASDGVHGTNLWKTDGTAAGTSRVSDLPFNFTPEGAVSPVASFTYANGLLFFGASMVSAAAGSGYELWRSDGTDAGTFLVRDILPGSGNGLRNGTLVKVGDRVFFAATTQSGFSPTYGLWVSDGTEMGTRTW
jgi:ELWxxDGT repeat protein